MNTFQIEIASVPDRDNLVAEIWLNDSLVCELNTDKGKLEIIFYSEKESEYDYDSFFRVLQEAREKLIGIG